MKIIEKLGVDANVGTEINIVEVGPRDGFQSVHDWIPTQTKQAIIEAMLASGLKRIQLTSFVSPKAVPQMRDNAELCAALVPRYGVDAQFSALVPNMHGAEKAIECGINELSYVLSASETHNRANTRRSISESLQDLKTIRDKWPHIVLNMDLAMTFGCPFEGEIPYYQVESLVGEACEIGADTVNLCDTSGLAVPTQVEDIVCRLTDRYPDMEFHIHIHDTRNMGILNTYIALKCGIRTLQTSLGGLGGCPFAPGATGNTATEDIIYMLDRIGWNTNVNFAELMKAARLLKESVCGNYSGHQIDIYKK